MRKSKYKTKNWWDKAKKIRKEADNKWQEICMLGGGLCEICGAEPAYTCHHIIPKSLSNRLRYELKNGIKIGMGCHNKIHSTADPAIFRKLDEIMGKKRIAFLEGLRRKEVKINEEFYQNNLERLNKLWITLKQERSASIPF